MRSPGRGVYASSGELFRKAVFGRDALEVSEDLLDIEPEIAHDVILTLARWIGTTHAPDGEGSTEEEIGRILHEHRELIVDGQPADPGVIAIINELSAKWGSRSYGMTYYGSIDATPLFIRLVDRYRTRAGSDDILAEVVADKDGNAVSIRSCVVAATEWVARAIEDSERTSGLGLLEHRRRNPRGVEYQGWRDGKTSMLHPARRPAMSTAPLPEPRAFEDCGELVDPDTPHAIIEVQGVAYDALLAAARMLAGTASEQRYSHLARSLRDNVFRHFWMPREEYFAVGIDRDSSGRPRPVTTITSAPAELLDTSIFDDLDPAQREKYVSAIVRHITSEDILNDAGVRTTSLRHRDQLDHVAYQGAFTVWHKQTFDIARGLRKHGFDRLATQLENRMLNTCNAGGMNNEFVYVDGTGRVCLDPANKRGRADTQAIPATNVPDECQAWTVSASLAIKWRRGHGGRDRLSRELWVRSLETEVMSRMPRRDVVRSRAELERMWEESPPFTVNRPLGKQLETDFAQRSAEARRMPPALRLRPGA